MKVIESNYEIIVSPEAEIELIASRSFYEDQKEGLGVEFLDEIELTINRISSKPLQFPSHRIQKVRKAKLKRFPFNLYFAIDGNIINILAVFHSSRNPRSLKKRT